MAQDAIKSVVTTSVQRMGLGRIYHNAWWELKGVRRSPWTEWNRTTGIVFIHIPKNAGTSIYRTFGMQEPDVTHCPASGYIAADTKAYREAYSFAFVRNPWDRVVSAFHYLKQKPIGQDDANWARDNLSEFVRIEDFLEALNNNGFRDKVLMWRHFRPQWHFLTDRFGRDAVTFVGHFERLEQDIETVGAQTGITPKLVKTNASKSDHYSVYFDDAAKDLIATLYAEDISRYNYTFDNKSTA